MSNNMPKLYYELASWWPLLSDPNDYKEEAAIYKGLLLQNSLNMKTLLELGSGGGNNASHLKSYFKMTLVDVSSEMTAVSKNLNPECEHIIGDMRDIRLGRIFDGVFIHDAIMYMTNETDLAKAMRTAFVHCKPGGCVLIVPDFFKETFSPKTCHGGHNSDTRSLRYLEWVYDPDPDDSTFITDFAYLLREENGSVHVEYDRHINGLFSRHKWLEIMGEVGFKAKIVPNAVLGLKLEIS